mgnify:CR=1 FL=1
MTKVGIKLWIGLAALAALVAVAYTVGDAGTGRSHQGTVVRAEVTLDGGSFEVQLTTNSNFTGQREWVNPGKTYTDRYIQDVLVEKNEVMQFWLTAATDIDRSIEKRTLRCQLYVNGKPLMERGRDSRVIRIGRSGDPAVCATVVNG